MKLNRKGFTLVEIMIVVAIIALLAAIAIPSFMKSRTEARKSACINNLRLLDHAKQQWMMTTNETAVATMTDLQGYLKNGQPSCPSGGSYTIGDRTTLPTCSYGNGHELPPVGAGGG